MRKENAVANYFIILGMGDSEEYMTNLRLNKLMYFAQSWMLSVFKKPLFQEDIEAWEYGPVVPSIYHQYKQYGKYPIDKFADEFSLNMFSDDEISVLSAVMACYRRFSTPGLVDITHAKNSPWYTAFHSNDKVIKKDAILQHFINDSNVLAYAFGNGVPVLECKERNGVCVLPSDWNEDGTV